MKCNNCGTEIPSQSRFCPSCGRPVSVAAAREVTSSAPRKPLGLWAAIVGLCIAVAALAAFILASRGNKVTQATPVPSPQQAPVLNAPQVPSAPQPNVLNTDVQKPKTEEPKKEVPPEVLAYLEHLKKVEKMRQDVTAQELNNLVAKAPELIAKAYGLDEDVDESSAPKALSNQASQFSKEWQQIAQYFVSVPAPEPCGQLARSYYDALGEFIRFMNTFQGAVNSTDLAKLKDLKRSQVSVDQKLTAADTELSNVCRKFGIDKSFSIVSDTGQTPITGF